MIRFFADTYALIRRVEEDKTYLHRTDGVWMTSQWNLVELYYYLLRQHNRKTADHFYKKYLGTIIPISRRAVRNGMALKLRHRTEKLSYVDCIGYALAAELGIPFLTGDVKFKGMANVEFVV